MQVGNHDFAATENFDGREGVYTRSGANRGKALNI